MRLVLKQLQPTTADEYITEHKLGDQVTGRVVEIQGSNARVEVAACSRVRLSRLGSPPSRNRVPNVI